MKLDDIPQLLQSSGVLLNNLFQLDSGVWRASIRTASHVYEYGDGLTPSDALTNALRRFRTGPGKPRTQHLPRATAAKDLKSLDANALLKELGL